MNARYRVELSQSERGELAAMLSKGKRRAVYSSAPRFCWRPDGGCSDELFGERSAGRVASIRARKCSSRRHKSPPHCLSNCLKNTSIIFNSGFLLRGRQEHLRGEQQRWRNELSDPLRRVCCDS
jgi:hypothetical protein